MLSKRSSPSSEEKETGAHTEFLTLPVHAICFYIQAVPSPYVQRREPHPSLNLAQELRKHAQLHHVGYVQVRPKPEESMRKRPRYL